MGARLAALAIGALIVCAALAGCGGDGDGDGRPNALVIYTSLPLQGPTAPVGRDMLNAERLALQDAGGRADGEPIELVALAGDIAPGERGHAISAAGNARRAAGDPRAIAYIGDANSGATAVAMPILNRAGILQVSPASTEVGLTVPDGLVRGAPSRYAPTGRRTFARLLPNDRVQAAALLKFMRVRRVKRVLIVHDDSLYGRGLDLQVRRFARDVPGIDVVGDIPAEPARVAAAVARTGPGALLYAGSTDGGALRIVQAAHRADPRLLFFGPDGVADRAFIGALGPLAPRVFITAPVLVPAAYPEAGRAFFYRYRSTFGVAPGPFAIHAYESMSAVLDSIAAAGRAGEITTDTARTREAVSDLFMAIRERDSVLGRYSIDRNGDSTLTDYGAYRIVAGRLVPGT